MAMEAVLELGMQVDVVQKFDEIFKQKLEVEEGKMINESPVFPRFRALKETLRSPEFAREPLRNQEIRTLGDYLLDKDKYSAAFKEWIGTRKLEWEHKTLPRNAHRLYAFGKKEIERRKVTFST